jgi:hypothetical protein
MITTITTTKIIGGQCLDRTPTKQPNHPRMSLSMNGYVDLLNKVTAAQLVSPKFKLSASSSELEFDTVREHGTGTCKCCTSPKIVKHNEEVWAQKWKEIQRQKRREKKWLLLQQLDDDGNDNNCNGSSGNDGGAKRWYRERERFEDLRWRFY